MSFLEMVGILFISIISSFAGSLIGGISAVVYCQQHKDDEE